MAQAKVPAKKPVAKKPAAAAPAPVEAAPAPVAAAPKSRSKKAAPAAAAPAPAPVAAPVAQPAAEGEGRVRRDVTVESVSQDFEKVLSSLTSQMEEVKTNPSKRGIKYLRSLGKQLKRLRDDVKRVVTRKHKTTRNRTTLSGFMKPVKISPELLAFIGGDASKEYSRNEVTKFICKYIKDQNLQTPEDKRNINCDAKLSKLLSYDVKTGPLTYPGIQKQLKHHFTPKAK